MPLTQSYLNKLSDRFPDIKLEESDSFKWSPSEKTVYYVKEDSNADQYLLHELSHALLEHTDFNHDIELLKLERDAWEYAEKSLAGDFGVLIDEDLVQDSLDTYRDWLHSRSTCPKCSSTGVQSSRSSYECLACGQKWRVNDGRSCGLRRHKIK